MSIKSPSKTYENIAQDYAHSVNISDLFWKRNEYQIFFENKDIELNIILITLIYLIYIMKTKGVLKLFQI